jgi:hypothetical protein
MDLPEILGEQSKPLKVNAEVSIQPKELQRRFKLEMQMTSNQD